MNPALMPVDHDTVTATLRQSLSEPGPAPQAASVSGGRARGRHGGPGRSATEFLRLTSTEVTVIRVIPCHGGRARLGHRDAATGRGGLMVTVTLAA